jgi:hypothetical protein
MKLLYAGGSGCSEPTLKRLLLVGTELVFMDRPSVIFGKWGTVGHQSMFRRIDTEGEPVTISAYAPPSGPASSLYEPYAIADFENPEFAKTVLEGLRADRAFASKFIQPEANYGDGVKGKSIIEALGRDTTLLPSPLHAESDPTRMFRVDSEEDRRATLKTIMADASVQVTSALVVADEVEAVPVADDPYFLKLLSLRTSGSKYIGGSAPHAWLLGVEFAKAVIPDQVLERLSVPNIVNYRRKSADVYRAWMSEVNKMAAKIDDLAIADAAERIPKMIATELEPRLVAYRADMASARDALFGNVLKGVTDWRAPALSLGSLAAMGYTAAIAAFVSTAALTTGKPVIDYVQMRRGAARKHAVSYLVGLADE